MIIYPVMYTHTYAGVFHSPNYPMLYPPNKECAWIFSTTAGHRIKLIFDQFDLENHQECAYDHVAVYDGLSVEDSTLGRFCGSRKPLTLVSSFDKMYLLFRSDATNERRGFNATHSTGESERLTYQILSVSRHNMHVKLALNISSHFHPPYSYSYSHSLRRQTAGSGGPE